MSKTELKNVRNNLNPEPSVTGKVTAYSILGGLVFMFVLVLSECRRLHAQQQGDTITINVYRLGQEKPVTTYTYPVVPVDNMPNKTLFTPPREFDTTAPDNIKRYMDYLKANKNSESNMSMIEFLRAYDKIVQRARMDSMISNWIHKSDSIMRAREQQQVYPWPGAVHQAKEYSH